MKSKERGSSQVKASIVFHTDFRLIQLRAAHSVRDVALALGLDPKKFFHVLKHTDDGRYYRDFEIPKKTGGYRQISKPVKGLALAQDRLSTILDHVYNPGSYVKAFVKKTSFVENARYHKAQRWILNIDLKDFFPSISFPRVRGLFLSTLFGFNERVATILARICTYKGSLPQGASTSPRLANIIAKSLDKKILEIAKSHQLKYTRYSDDISLSSSKKVIPTLVVKNFHDNPDGRDVILGDGLKNAVRSSGFFINASKTRLMMPNNRQEVTGLVVNKRVNVRRTDIAKLRMKIHSVKKVGFSEAAKVWVDGNEAQLKNHLVGWLAHIRQVRGPSDPVLAKLCLQAHEAGLTEIKWIEELADMSKEFDVFLSHASEDKERVRRLQAELEERKVSVFFDESTIKWGDSIVEKVNHGLLKSTFFIPFLTETFSKKGWTNRELNSAIQMNMTRKRRILPIKSPDFDVDSKYPLLNDTLYKTWPRDPADEAAFISEISDELVALIEMEKSSV
ncbi:TIR domain-containing protein [Shimia sp. R9_2]|uniref:TIR domain-containing anti-phage reverse transcriptase n=1 Tax=Shimia sp. R9_2 TaxID=2821112 RepID=UPI001ADD18DF|nr:TIR domain-containing anti-phage reverse transcriptase [Shimia sp. R9_2]MBO9397319.1 TIR domain-containing protein [Shimia sp. R9_2]